MAGNANKYQFNAEEAINKLYQKGLMSDTNTGFLQTLIDDKLEIASNAFFWQEHFTVDGTEYQPNLSNKEIEPAWTVRSKTTRIVPMADAMAPLSETAQLDGIGYETRNGSIHQYGKGLYQNSLNKLELEARLREFDTTDQNLINGFIVGVSDLIKTGNYRLSHMAAQALSGGGAYSNIATKGWSGVSAVQGAYIPVTNFVKAGEKPWTQMTQGNECDIPTQMQKIEYDFKIAHNIDESALFEWDIPYDMVMNVLLKNPYFIKEVNRYIQLYAPDKVIIINNSANSVSTSVITWEQLVQYSRSSISKISPIRIVKQSQTVQDITTVSTVNGWAANKVVLRPLGYAGVVVHAKPYDIAMYQSGEVNDRVQINTAISQGFLYVINKLTDDGMFKAYHTDVIGCYAPILNEIMEHVVVDTATPD